MSPPSPSASPVPSHQDKLRHLPEAAQAAYHRFVSGRDPKDLDIVVFAIVQDFAPKRPGPSIAAAEASSRLMEDLGLDSLAITEIAFFAEDLFKFSISNEEILQVRTIDDLRGFIRRKAASSGQAEA